MNFFFITTLFTFLYLYYKPGKTLLNHNVKYSDIQTLIHGINRATMPRHTFQRYEVNLKANVAPLISDNPIKELDKTVYSPTGYREPFFSSW